MRIDRRKISVALLLLIVLLAFGNGVVLFMIPISEFTFRIFLSNSLMSLLVGGTMAIGISRIVLWHDRKHPWLKNPLKRLLFQSVTTIGFILLVIGLVVLYLIIADKNKLPSEIIKESGFFMVKVALFFLVLSMLITNALFFFRNWKKSVVLQEQMKREQLSLQYETLKSQVNPHFLFNSLNSVSSLIKSDPDKAILFVRKLSDVFRYVLEQKDNELCALEEELSFLDSYVFLQKIRFGDNLIFQKEVSGMNRYVVPLSLQMLVENAIKHNIMSKEFPLTIRVYSGDDGYVTVSNNLHKKADRGTGGLGLANIRSRYEFFTSNPVTVTETENSFKVGIPLIEKRSL
jgi:LytS/YehU family sensor histidine kinase